MSHLLLKLISFYVDSGQFKWHIEALNHVKRQARIKRKRG